MTRCLCETVSISLPRLIARIIQKPAQNPHQKTPVCVFFCFCAILALKGGENHWLRFFAKKSLFRFVVLATFAPFIRCLFASIVWISQLGISIQITVVSIALVITFALLAYPSLVVFSMQIPYIKPVCRLIQSCQNVDRGSVSRHDVLLVLLAIVRHRALVFFVQHYRSQFH